MEARCFVFFFFFLEKFSIIADRFSIVSFLRCCSRMWILKRDGKYATTCCNGNVIFLSSIRRKCYDTCSNLITR